MVNFCSGDTGDLSKQESGPTVNKKLQGGKRRGIAYCCQWHGFCFS